MAAGVHIFHITNGRTCLDYVRAMEVLAGDRETPAVGEQGGGMNMN